MKQNFSRDLKFGRRGERYVQSLLKNKYDIDSTIVDEKGHDIVVKQNNIKIECKADKWIKKTGNVCLELFSHVGLSSVGWMQYADCNLLAYIQADENDFESVIFYDFFRLKRFVFAYLLRGDWSCDSPVEGKITSAYINNNSHVKNLLVPKESINQFVVDESEVFRPPRCLHYCDGKYLVFDNGTIISTKTGRPLSSHLHGGRRRVSIEGNKVYVDVLVATLFLKKPSPEFVYVNHKDGNLDNDNHFNLEWSLTKNDYLINGDTT